ncbi:internal (core) protein [Enterobacter phage 03_vB_Eclo_IJM]|nr:internal (core) protein [Enterobacter phage 03_vB_Eclo_IJM]
MASNIESASANRTMGRGRAPGKAISLDYQAANVQGQTGDSGLAKALTDFVSTGAGVINSFRTRRRTSETNGPTRLSAS